MSANFQATETVFRMAVTRGIINPLKHGEVLPDFIASLFSRSIKHSKSYTAEHCTDIFNDKLTYI